MTQDQNQSTRDVAQRWFDALFSGRIDDALECLSPDVEFINYKIIPGHNDEMPWIGTYHGREAVLNSFKTFIGVAQPQKEELVKLIVEGEDAIGIVHEISEVRKTQKQFEIEFIQWLIVRDGHIVRWKSYTDPSPIIAAIEGE